MTTNRSFAFLMLVALLGCTSGPTPSGDSSGARPGSDWTVIGPGGGGSTFLPTFSPLDPQTMLIRCDMTGGYLTRDGGQSWQLHNFPGGAQSFALDPSDLNRMYVGASGLHGSADGGRSWTLLFPRPDSITEIRHHNDHASLEYVSSDNFPEGVGSSVRAIWIDPADSEHLLIVIAARKQSGSVSVIFESTDGGGSFETRGELEGSVIRLLPADKSAGELLAFTRSAIHRLSPRGVETGSATNLPEEVTPVGWVDAGTIPDEGATALWLTTAGTGRFGDSGELFLSTDLGRSWNKTGPPVEPSVEDRAFSHVATSASDGRVAYLACPRSIETNAEGKRGLRYGILKTEDLGKSWKWVYRAGGGSSDYTVRDGQEAGNLDDSWVKEAFSGEYIRILHTGVSPSDPKTAVFTDWYRAMKTTDGGESWQALYSETLPDGSVRSRGLDVTTSYGVHFDPFDADHLAISYTDIGYFHSFDRGETWRRSVEGIPPPWDNTCYWVQFDPEVKGRLWSVWSSWHDIPRMKMIVSPDWKQRAVGGVCLSDDGGKNWTVTSEGLPQNSPTTSMVLDPESSAEARTLYIAVYGQGVFKTVDGGASWQPRNAGLGENRNAWEVSLASDGTLYLVVAHSTRFEGGKILPDLLGGELYRSTDGADSWEPLPLPDGVRFPNSLALDAQTPGRLYLAAWANLTKGDYDRRAANRDETVASKGGAFLSEDGGQSWRSVFDPSAYVYGLTIDQRHPGRLYLNTFHNTAWRSDNWGEDWKQIRGYDFQWGHRPVVDPHDPEKIYLTTFGGSVMYGTPATVD